MGEMNSSTEIMKVYEAASGNHIKELKQALDGACGELSKEDLELAILIAAKNGHCGCVEILLENKMNVTPRDGQDNTPLILASEGGHVDVVRTLIKHGCSVNCQNSLGMTALMKACEQGHVMVAKILIEEGADDDETRHNNQLDLSSLSKVGSKLSPLMIAVLKAPQNQRELVELLLRRESAVFDMDAEQRTTLHFAARTCNVSVLELLLSAGAKVNAKDFWGVTPLMNAVSCNSVDNTQVLLKHGADVNIPDNTHRSALSIASRSDASQLVEILLTAGADIDHLDAHKNTPLFTAISHRNHSAAKSLIKHGCNLALSGRHMTTRKVMSFLQLSVWCKDTQMIEILYCAGAFTDGDLYNMFIDPFYSNHCADQPDVWEYLSWLIRQPRPLISSCRHVILRSCQRPQIDSVDRLPLPTGLKEYLKFSDVVV